ncbi:hypothetical protein C8Q79DRAFT_784165 [Trametes meyenii]|nr:hypothetical protein C8Q79DRAFT_784165 [Trametes meyenii]
MCALYHVLVIPTNTPLRICRRPRTTERCIYRCSPSDHLRFDRGACDYRSHPAVLGRIAYTICAAGWPDIALKQVRTSQWAIISITLQPRSRRIKRSPRSCRTPCESAVATQHDIPERSCPDDTLSVYLHAQRCPSCTSSTPTRSQETDIRAYFVLLAACDSGRHETQDVEAFTAALDMRGAPRRMGGELCTAPRRSTPCALFLACPPPRP